MMTFLIGLVISGVLGCTGYLVARSEAERRAAARQAQLDAAERAREVIRANPADWIRGELRRATPERGALQARVADARAGVDSAEGEVRSVLTGFADGAEPSRSRVIVVLIMASIWAVAFVAVAFLEYPIVLAVSGGNVLMAALGTIIAVVLPTVASLLMALAFAARNRGLSRAPFAMAITGLLMAFIATVALMSSLATIRADVEYADQILLADQQITMYRADGDQEALDYSRQRKAQLEREREQSKKWNQILVPLGAAVEFGTGFFAPGAIPILQLRAARRRKAQAEAGVQQALHAVDAYEQFLQARLSRDLADAGVPQTAIDAVLAPALALPQEGDAVRPQPQEEQRPAETPPDAQAAEPEPEPEPVHAGAPRASQPSPAPEAPAHARADAPDPRFDLS